MGNFCPVSITILIIVIAGLLVPALTEADEPGGDTEISARHFGKKKCYKYGNCGGGGFGGFGGFGGYQGGYSGYPAQYPPINIGISQSQSSASAGGGGFGSGYYPNNYQYNGNPYPGYGRPGGFNRPGYYENGLGSYNNQFNGNYYGPSGSVGYPGGGWNGFRQPYGNFYEGDPDIYADPEERDRQIYRETMQGFSSFVDDAFGVFGRSGSAASARSATESDSASSKAKER